MNTADTALAPRDMEEVLQTNIKDFLAAYPATGQVLGEFGIACITCNVGTCKTKDVVSVHSLAPEQEEALFTRIAQLVFPDRQVRIPLTPRPAATAAPLRRSPPMEELVEEHRSIKRVIALIPRDLAALSAGLTDRRRQRLALILDFIRNFADRYHHAKEEDLLFPYFDPQNPMLLAMHQDHEIGRSHVRATAAALDAGAIPAIREHLAAYGALLSEHIRREDDLLYPWMDRELNDSQVGRLASAFREVDARFGDRPAFYRDAVTQLEQEQP